MSNIDRFLPGERPTVDAIELRRLRLPLRAPFRAAHGTEHERDVVLVGLTIDGGAVGWGECPTLSRPTYIEEYTDLAWEVLRDGLGPAWLAGETSGIERYPMASSALEAALLDALARWRGRRLVDTLGWSPRPVPACAVLGLARSIDDLLDEARARMASGYRHLKLKIQPGWDVEPLAAVRAVAPQVTLAADANGSYSSPDAVPSELDGLRLAYLEQPLAPSDLEGSAAVAARVATPVALDESILSPDDVDTAADRGAVEVVNVKPARLGGLAAAVETVERAARSGLGVFVGGMLESGVGRAAALAVASHPACTLPTDLGPSDRYFAQDITAPLELSAQGCMEVPPGPGTGVTPRPELVERFTVDAWAAHR